MQKKDIPFLAEKLDEMFPNAKTELYYTNKFQLLIAILLSAQTTDKQVNKVTNELFKILKTPED
jgi:endonuclease-3